MSKASGHEKSFWNSIGGLLLHALGILKYKICVENRKKNYYYYEIWNEVSTL